MPIGDRAAACEVNKVTPFFIEHDAEGRRAHSERGDIVGAQVTARRTL